MGPTLQAVSPVPRSSTSATSARALATLRNDIITCRACPRLVAWREQVAVDKRASYRDDVYWGRPISGFGDPDAAIVVLGLAPAAHGANRTGRMFTGDRSGDWLFQAMHEAGLASQPASVQVHDGLTLHNCLITAACHCAPPANKPARVELERCSAWLDATVAHLTNLQVVVCLGRIAFDAALKLYRRQGWIAGRRGLKFAHGAMLRLPGAPTLVCSYHPSQQNTFTGRLTRTMLRDIFTRARREAGLKSL